MTRFCLRPAVAALLAAVTFAAASSRQMIVRVKARDYHELFRHIQFKGTSLSIAGASVGEWYDLELAERDLWIVKGSGLAYEVLVEDIGEAMRRAMLDGQYHSYDSLVLIMRGWCSSYPALCRMDSIGPTHENRWIYGVKISDNPGVDEDEPEVLYVGVHHAREWATPQVCRHLADTLIRNYSSNTAFRNFIDAHELWVFPVINVDGYVYDYPAARSWRKDRQPFGGYYGCDPNRDYNGCCNGNRMGDWGSLVASSNTSHMPSDAVFFGASGAWGKEITCLSEFFKQHTFVGVISYHSYGELVLWPYGHGERTPDSVYLRTLGQGVAAQTQRLAGGTYTPQQSNYLYPTNGGSDDWMYGWAHYVGGFPCMSYTVEVGTAFYQSISQLDNIQTQNFKGAWYHMLRSDSIIAALEGAVPRPILARVDTVGPSFTLHWTPIRPEHNHPDRWELEELTGLTVITDSLEAGAGRWTLVGASVSTTQRHSGTSSISLGNGNNIANYAMTTDPYPVQPGDSLTYWIWYNTESNYDVTVAEVSLEGKEWIQLHDRLSGNSAGWLRRAYSLGPWAGRSVFIRFRYMTDDNTLGSGVYVDDIWPVPAFVTRSVVSANITDTLYDVSGKTPGRYFYRVRGRNVAWNWNDRGPLEDAVVTVAAAADIGVTRIAAPAGTIDSSASVTPQAWVENFGDTASHWCPAVFRAGGFYLDTVTVPGLEPGESALVSFEPRTGWPRGTWAVSCSTELPGDRDSMNDKLTDSVFVRVRDEMAIGLSPQNGATDSVPYNYPVQVRFTNNGNATTDTVPVRFAVIFERIGGYQEDDNFIVAPGETVQTVFVPDEMPRGTHQVLFYTRMTGDMNRTNDTVRGTVFVQVRDKAIAQVTSPRSPVYVPYPEESTTVTPAAVVVNYGNVNDSAPAKVAYRVFSGTTEIYADSAWTSAPLAAGAQETLSFAEVRLGLGFYRAVARTEQTDMRPGNDSFPYSFTVSRDRGDVGWKARAPIPGGTSGRSVKDGGSLTFDLGSRRIYALKGNKTPEFFSYNPERDSWTALPGLPYQQHPVWSRKAPKKGARVAASGNGLVYVTQGNNSLGFWRYSVPESTWAVLTDVPAGTKKVKGGTDLEYVVRNDTGYVYLLKGYRDEFYRYNTGTGQWEQLPNAPTGGGIKYNEGSFLVYDGAGRVLCHKAKFNELWPFDIALGTWGARLEGMPLLGSSGRTKKSRDGGCGTRSGNGILALKGGNTYEFWRYDFTANAWAQLEDMPYGSGKKVKTGADITTIEDGSAYALKGNKTFEFYQYVSGGIVDMATSPLREGVQAAATGHLPATQAATLLRSDMELRAAVPYSVYNRLGVLVQKGSAATGRQRLNELPAGVYFVRTERSAGTGWPSVTVVLKVLLVR